MESQSLKDAAATPQQDEWSMLDDRFSWYDMMYESPLDAFSAHEHFQSGRSSIWASMLDLGLLSVDPAQVMQEDALMQTTYPSNDSEGNHPHPASAPPVISSAITEARSNAEGPRSQPLQWDEQRWNWSDEMARMSMDSRASIILGYEGCALSGCMETVCAAHHQSFIPGGGGGTQRPFGWVWQELFWVGVLWWVP